MPRTHSRESRFGSVLAAAGVALLAGCRPDPPPAFEGGRVSPTGSFVYLVSRDATGEAPRGFFLDTASGRSTEVPAAPDPRLVAFAADGARVVFASDASRFSIRDLSRPEASPREIAADASKTSCLTLSPKGDRVAILEDTRVVVADAATGRIVASRPVPEPRVPRTLLFTTEGRLRLLPTQRHEGGREEAARVDVIFEADAAANATDTSWHETGRVTSDFPGLFLRANAGGTRLLSLERRRTRVTLRDGRTGDPIALLPTGAPENVEILGDSPVGKLRSAAFLADGRIVALLHAARGCTLAMYASDGAPGMRVPLAESDERAAVLGEAVRGSLVLSLGGKKNVRDARVLIVDLETGTVVHREEGLVPLDEMAFWYAPSIGPAPAANARLFLDERGALVALEPPHFSPRTVFGSRAR